MKPKTVLIVDDEPTVRFGIRRFLQRRGFGVREAGSCAEAVECLAERWPETAVFDHRLPDGTALDLLDHVCAAGAPTQVVVLTAHGTIDLAVEAMQRGASNFLTKPVEMETLASLLEAVSGAARAEPVPVDPEGERDDAPDPFLGTSAAIRTLEERARKVCLSGSPVLILGETGSGKGVLARWLHAHSHRPGGPFIDLNCGGLNRELLESELFGYKAGAFTGAHQDKPGLLEVADQGSVFLDEIGDADLRVQTKLLKVLEERKVRRLGEVKERTIDFRLIAATHWDLPDRIRSGEFRKDLYYRISILPLMIPPLRDRPEDVPVLTRAILDRVAPHRVADPDEDAMALLQRHHWPGNVRELRNVLERALLLSSRDRIRPDDIHFDHFDQVDVVSPEPAASSAPSILPASGVQDPGTAGVDLTLEESEIRHIRQVLREMEGNVSRAAEKLDVPRSSLYEKLKRYGIRPSSER